MHYPRKKKITYSHRGLNPIKICAKLLPLNKNIRCINGAEVLPTERDLHIILDTSMNQQSGCQKEGIISYCGARHSAQIREKLKYPAEFWSPCFEGNVYPCEKFHSKNDQEIQKTLYLLCLVRQNYCPQHISLLNQLVLQSSLKFIIETESIILE